jgi:tetratricopeptide (TPR) repeat protein
MTSINPRFLALPLLCLVLSGTVSGQSAGTDFSPLEAEIRTIEGKLAGSPAASERREAYVTLARLQRLSGNVDAAAWAWREAGRADPENRDDRCFLESALCYLALGEFDAASDALRGIVDDGRDTGAVRDAGYIRAQIDVFRTGSTASLYALLEKAEFQQYRPAIYYTFWRLFADAAYKAQILSEFPDSPEALILKSEDALAAENTAPVPGIAAGTIGTAGTAGQVSALNRPLWFFYPGRGNVVIGAAVPSRPPAAQPLPAAAAPAVLSPAAVTPDSEPVSPGGPRALQTGLFSREENAQAMVSRLASRGFTAELSHKPVNGVTYWVVTVPPGEDSGHTIMRLKDAGFESFPVF